MATWHSGRHISDISALHSICQTSTKCQFLITVFIPLGKLFLCLLVCSVAGVGAAVWPQATCPLLTQISPAQGRAEAGVATLKDPGTKVKDFHWEKNCKSFMQG